MGSTKAVSGFQKEAGGAVLARRPLFWVLCRPNLTASSRQSWEEVGDPPDVCLRTPRSQKSLSPLRGHGLVQLQCGHALVTGRAFAARAVKVPQHLFWGHVSEIQNVPVWLFQLTPSRGFSPVSIAGAPSPSTRRQETEEQHRRGRPQAVRPGPGAVSTRGSPSPLCRKPAGPALGGPRHSPSLGEVQEQGWVSASVSAGSCHTVGRPHLGWVWTGDAHGDRLRRRFQAFLMVKRRVLGSWSG